MVAIYVLMVLGLIPTLPLDWSLLMYHHAENTTTSTTTPTTIEAVNDGVTTITSTTGGTTPSVLTNDKLNGVPNPSISSVTLTWNTATPTGFTLNPNGTIRVAPNTPAGTHTISYTICAVASPTVCSTAYSLGRCFSGVSRAFSCFSGLCVAFL